MKKLIALSAIWIIALSFLLASSWAQTNISSEYRQPGDLLVRMSNGAVPIVEKAQTWLQVAQNVLTGVLTAVGALLAWLAKVKTEKAETSGTINSVLIQEIQKVADKKFKDAIAGAARDAGVGDDLHKVVKANTPSTPATVSDYTAELLSTWPKSVVPTPLTEPFDYRAALDAAVKPPLPVTPPTPAVEVKPI